MRERSTYSTQSDGPELPPLDVKSMTIIMISTQVGTRCALKNAWRPNATVGLRHLYVKKGSRSRCLASDLGALGEILQRASPCCTVLRRALRHWTQLGIVSIPGFQPFSQVHLNRTINRNEESVIHPDLLQRITACQGVWRTKAGGVLSNFLEYAGC